ncbi:MAG TPA: Fur family transcriptional regulator [Thermoleophilaceae bacterium]|nr:Fur family transcriptional regulator [Thermoleophilaceae bacterium]
MSATATSPWIEHALGVLAEHGHRAGGARTAVIDALGRHGGCVDADALVATLRADGSRVGVASVYRALGLLAALGLLQRVPVAGGSARYELVGPGDAHHHHIVCDDCGATTAFEDEGLERAIGRVSGRTAFAVQAHDVTLHGTCPDCQRS